MIAAYFQQFAEDHELLERITFRTRVTKVAPLPGPGAPGSNGWAVTTAKRQTRRYRHVLIANGHHCTPKLPDFPGEFTGEVFHSHDYRDPKVFLDKDVVVVGVGNSGMDIACDAARTARSVHLVTRHGVHVLPKYAFGKPIDQLGNPLTAYLPFPVERRLYEAILRVSTGRPQDRGLPKPDHRLLEAHPTVSAELYDRVGHGDVTMKPGIERLDGDKIAFADDTVEHTDVLVYATGYRISLPFLDPEVYHATGNRMPLYQRVLTPDRPGLFFIGFMQTVGANIPLFEYQSEWVGDLLTGAAALPSEQRMRQWIEEDQAAQARRYVRSERHTMQVDYWRYIRAMKEARATKPDPSLADRVTRAFAGLR
jgi:hypothetical protein